MAKPLIAITGPKKGAFWPRSLVALALRCFGARVVQLKPGDNLEHAQYHGVVITGGNDVEPVLYAAEPEVTSIYDSERDAFEIHIIKLAIARNLPVLGICRGAQLINITAGGSLFQDLRSHRKRTTNRWTILPIKTLKLVAADGSKTSLLRNIMGDGPFHINSLHNQAINSVGAALIVTARDEDHIAQAIEQPDKSLVIGVQWHPEYLLYLKSQRKLFEALVKHAQLLSGPQNT